MRHRSDRAAGCCCSAIRASSATPSIRCRSTSPTAATAISRPWSTRCATPSASATPTSRRWSRAVSPTAGLRQERDKLFYVSPFIGMGMRYQFRLRPPTETVTVRILETDATRAPSWRRPSRGRGEPLTTTSLAAAFAALPFMALKVIAGIHWEALKLWFKGLHLHPRPRLPQPVSYGARPWQPGAADSVLARGGGMTGEWRGDRGHDPGERSNAGATAHRRQRAAFLQRADPRHAGDGRRRARPTCPLRYARRCASRRGWSEVALETRLPDGRTLALRGAARRPARGDDHQHAGFRQAPYRRRRCRHRRRLSERRLGEPGPDALPAAVLRQPCAHRPRCSSAIRWRAGGSSCSTSSTATRGAAQRATSTPTTTSATASTKRGSTAP